MADNKDIIMATGRRKTSIAVVKLVKGSGRIFVNGKTLKNYIGNRPAIEMLVYRPLVLTETQDRYDVRVKANTAFQELWLKQMKNSEMFLKLKVCSQETRELKNVKNTGEKELVRDSNSLKDSVSRCGAGVGLREQDEQGETLRYRRCDRNESEGSEAIYDCTGGKTLINTKKNRPKGRFFFVV